MKSPAIVSLGAFPDIKTLALLSQQPDTLFEIHDNYLKQTYRNRYRISGSTGAVELSIPVNFSQSNRAYNQVTIDYRNHWNRTHWRTLTANYNNSPYFNYYCDAYEDLFRTPVDTLMEFNLKALGLLCKDFGLKMPSTTDQWVNQTDFQGEDLRDWIHTKSFDLIETPEYFQVFSDRFGFINGCSSLDLLFCMGPDARFYLMDFQLPSNR
jgi:hypothetical protein